MSDDQAPTRRQFHHSLALLAAPLLPGQAAAQDKQASVADQLTAIARIKYGQHLTPEQLDELKESILRDQYGNELLRKVPLKNGDEPSFVFRADLP